MPLFNVSPNNDDHTGRGADVVLSGHSEGKRTNRGARQGQADIQGQWLRDQARVYADQGFHVCVTSAFYCCASAAMGFICSWLTMMQC